MSDTTTITPGFTISGAITPADLQAIADAGFRTVINNRPDGESPGQSTAAELALRARALELDYHFIPATKHDLFCEDVVARTADVLSAADGPVFAHCASGMRSAIIWAAAQSRVRPVEAVLADLENAGLELDFLRDELDQQAAIPLSRSSVDDFLAGSGGKDASPDGASESKAA